MLFKSFYLKLFQFSFRCWKIEEMYWLKIIKEIFYIVKYSGFAWRIIMGCIFDDWVYWYFFTITVDYNSSDIELLLNDVCVTNLSLVSDRYFSSSNSRIHCLCHFHAVRIEVIMSYNSSVILFHPLLQNVCQSRGNALIPLSVFVSAKRVLTIRCLAIDYFVTILSDV
jgi:hypothetical protein